jgi:hypothetical protein
MAKREVFPKQVFVRIEVDGDDFYLLAEKSAEDIPADEDGSRIGIYAFVGMQTLKVTKELI